MSERAKILETGIVHMPGRKYPGVVIQGDSLAIWRTHVEAAREALVRGDLDEARAELTSLEDGMSEWQTHYEKALKKHGFDLPYVQKRMKG
jgi:hypothetical protein